VPGDRVILLFSLSAKDPFLRLSAVPSGHRAAFNIRAATTFALTTALTTGGDSLTRRAAGPGDRNCTKRSSRSPQANSERTCRNGGRRSSSRRL